MNEDALAAAGYQGAARCHVHRHVLVRTQHDLGCGAIEALPTSELFDNRGVIGTKIAKQIVDADLIQGFDKIMSTGISLGLASGGSFRRHCCVPSSPSIAEA